MVELEKVYDSTVFRAKEKLSIDWEGNLVKLFLWVKVHNIKPFNVE